MISGLANGPFNKSRRVVAAAVSRWMFSCFWGRHPHSHGGGYFLNGLLTKLSQ